MLNMSAILAAVVLTFAGVAASDQPTPTATATASAVASGPITHELPNDHVITGPITHELPNDNVTTAPDAAPEVCQEDMPCWDCNTMGNLICGPAESCQEDMPCWDCTTMGDLICGPNTEEQTATIQDAWTAFDAMDAPPVLDTDYRVEYAYSTTTAPRLNCGEYAAKSTTAAHTWHVFTAAPTAAR